MTAAWWIIAGLALCGLCSHAAAEDVCQGPVVELQLEAQDGSFVETEYGVVAAFGALPSTNRTRPARLVAAAPLDACAPLTEPLDGAVAIVKRGTCSFVDKYLAVLAAGGSAMLMYNDGPGCITMGGTLPNTSSSDTKRITAAAGGAAAPIPAISIDHEIGAKLVNVSQYGPLVLVSIALLDLPAVDASAAVLWLMAVATVAGGAIWSGADHAAELKAAAAAGEEDEGEQGDGQGGRRRGRRSGGGAPGEGALDVSAAGACAFVCVSSGMLLLLYFCMNRAFFYIILGLFALSAAQALALLLAAAAAAAAPALEGRSANLPWVGPVDGPMLVAAPLAAAAAGVWLVFRSARWSWPLLDLLGIALMLLVLRTLRLGGLRVACVLLPLCFAYDVFFVFLQPLIFGGGESVMVEVARGAGADEALPMLLRVPRLSGPPIAGGYSMLGFGDVIIPGLLVALMRRADVETRTPVYSPRGYFAPTLAAYGAGLILTYVALVFSWFGDQGQPALLYLTPATLGTALGLAAARGDLRRLWDPEGSSSSGSGGGSGWALLLPGSSDGDEEEIGGGSSGGGGQGAAAAAAAAADGGGRRGRQRSSSGGSGGNGGGGVGAGARLMSRSGSQAGTPRV